MPQCTLPAPELLAFCIRGGRLIGRGLGMVGHKRRTAWACAIGVAAVALTTGCVGVAESPEQAAAHDTSIADTRAGYVDLMIENIVGTSAPMHEGDIFAIVAGYGGGYVTDATVSGGVGTPTETLTFDAVLGAAGITDKMQGESYDGPSAIACYRFTTGYYAHSTHTGIPCAAGVTAARAASEARIQTHTTAVAAASRRFHPGQAMPIDLAQAERIAGVGSSTHSSTDTLTAVDFAAGDGAAALALPQPAGGCVYLRFTSAAATSTTAGGVNTYGWAAPTNAPCTGSAALANGGYVTHDAHAGG